MSHETSSASTLTQLLTRLATFASSHGWIIDKLDTITPALYLRNAEGYWSMGVQSNNLFLFGNTGFDAGLSINQQPGSCLNNNLSSSYNRYIGTRVSDMAAGNYVSYDFFGTERYLHIAVQIKSHQFRHFGVGTLIKEGVYAGGQYAYGTSLYNPQEFQGNNANAYPFTGYSSAAYPGQVSDAKCYPTTIRADINTTKAPHWYSFGIYDGSNLMSGVGAAGNGTAGVLESFHPDRLSGMSSLSHFGQVIAPVPNTIYIRTPDGVYRRLGYVPDFYVCQMLGVVPRTDVIIANERWRLIPALQLQTTTAAVPVGENNSYTIGYAFRIVD